MTRYKPVMKFLSESQILYGCAALHCQAGGCVCCWHPGMIKPVLLPNMTTWLMRARSGLTTQCGKGANFNETLGIGACRGAVLTVPPAFVGCFGTSLADLLG